MILDDLSQAGQYAGLHSGFGRAFAFLSNADPVARTEGRHEIDGEACFAMVARAEGRGCDGAPLEFHRKFIDIQYIVEGTDLIGWSPLSDCNRVKEAYDETSDLGFFLDKPKVWLPVQSGQFAIFFPSDAHAPLAGESPVHKVVIKIAV